MIRSYWNVEFHVQLYMVQILHWIDTFAEDPATDLDRTMGSWTNLMRALHTIPVDVRDQVTLKAFSHRGKGAPQCTGTSATLSMCGGIGSFGMLPGQAKE